MREQRFRELRQAMVPLLPLLLLPVVGVVAFSWGLDKNGSWPLVLGAALGAMVAGVSLTFARVYTRNPTPLRIALIGPRGCGKTVYLTTLFSEVKNADFGTVAFQPYGVETVEQVLGYMELLLSQQWPPATPPGDVIPYRAKATVQGGLFARRYTVEIGDYAGEHIEEFDSSSPRWLHRTKYFAYAMQSDVIFLAVDAEDVLLATDETIGKIEAQLVAVLQILLGEKGVAPDEKLAVPVVVVILKGDLLPEFRIPDKSAWEDLVGSKLGRLIGLAERRCMWFKCVLVSSVGRVDEQGRPCVPLDPWNVVEPLTWALLHARPTWRPHRSRAVE